MKKLLSILFAAMIGLSLSMATFAQDAPKDTTKKTTKTKKTHKTKETDKKKAEKPAEETK
jgi:hypothetical protein